LCSFKAIDLYWKIIIPGNSIHIFTNLGTHNGN